MYDWESQLSSFLCFRHVSLTKRVEMECYCHTLLLLPNLAVSTMNIKITLVTSSNDKKFLHPTSDGITFPIFFISRDIQITPQHQVQSLTCRSSVQPIEKKKKTPYFETHTPSLMLWVATLYPTQLICVLMYFIELLRWFPSIIMSSWVWFSLTQTQVNTTNCQHGMIYKDVNQDRTLLQLVMIMILKVQLLCVCLCVLKEINRDLCLLHSSLTPKNPARILS